MLTYVENAHDNTCNYIMNVISKIVQKNAPFLRSHHPSSSWCLIIARNFVRKTQKYSASIQPLIKSKNSKIEKFAESQTELRLVNTQQWTKSEAPNRSSMSGVPLGRLPQWSFCRTRQTTLNRKPTHPNRVPSKCHPISPIAYRRQSRKCAASVRSNRFRRSSIRQRRRSTFAAVTTTALATATTPSRASRSTVCEHLRACTRTAWRWLPIEWPKAVSGNSRTNCVNSDATASRQCCRRRWFRCIGISACESDRCIELYFVIKRFDQRWLCFISAMRSDSCWHIFQSYLSSKPHRPSIIIVPKLIISMWT